MFFVFFRLFSRRLAVLAISCCAAGILAAAPTGPTLQLGYDPHQPRENPLGKFMYFVPLISLEPITLLTNAGDTQCARILSWTCRTNAGSFTAVCGFEFSGTGCQQNIVDHNPKIRARQKLLEAGNILPHQLDSISVEGAGSGSVEVTGILTNGQPLVTEIQMHFNGHNQPSPVSVGLVDIAWRNGQAQFTNAKIARVNTLIFHRKTGTPKMEVTLASVKAKDAGDGFWSNFVGDLKGSVANFFLPPLTIDASGQDAMLNFGLALVTQKSSFTFPFAARLKTTGQAPPLAIKN